MGDVEIDRAALQSAGMSVGLSTMAYHGGAATTWAGDTGVENPCGRTTLRVMLENAIGAARMTVRAQSGRSVALQQHLVEIVDAFDELDASLGTGWNRGR